jgi:hypothetical protein
MPRSLFVFGKSRRAELRFRIGDNASIIRESVNFDRLSFAYWDESSSRLLKAEKRVTND